MNDDHIQYHERFRIEQDLGAQPRFQGLSRHLEKGEDPGNEVAQC